MGTGWLMVNGKTIYYKPSTINHNKLLQSNQFLINNRKYLFFCFRIDHCDSCKTTESRQHRIFFSEIKTWKTKGLFSRTLNADTRMNMT